MRSHRGLLLGIDVGGTKIAGVAVDARSGELLAERRQPVEEASLEGQVVGVARALIDAAGGEPLAALGVAVPGLVDTDAGVMRLAVNVDAGELAIGPLVAKAMGAPCFVEHDARAAALWLLERGDPGDSLAYLSVGTGISAAIVIAGRLVRGVTGLAGEIGHTQAVEMGPRCPCGLTGCLEAVAAGPAVARMATEAAASGEMTSLSNGATGPETVYRAAAAGDAVALAIADRVGVHLARAIRGIVLSYGVNRVVIGGGMSRAGESFLRPILDELEREQAASPLISHALTPNPVELLPPDSEPGAWGAVVVARSRLRDATPVAPEREVADA
jgi:predicted NBD/HSP70 family sugar kinase